VERTLLLSALTPLCQGAVARPSRDCQFDLCFG
jgi:hypothetical protein